ncbi:metallophosphoesterase family protein [Aeromicrobium sp. 179-A 4D2 NHS]|uniref:metallophosphoesterase family protein n=1 Tax=Aeromicrobium sp. 179-A 4D2 NHS TaxID=3142375 RepID=UPI00399FCD4D
MDQPYPNLHDIAPTRVLICGDWHGDTRHAKAAIALADRVGADGILHVGDFGWSWKRDHPKTFNVPVEEELAKRDIFLIWADGNHENHKAIRDITPRKSDGFVPTGDSGRLFWAPRAHRWNWLGVEFAAMGGAMSVNREDYTEGETLFSDLEEVKPGDVELLGDVKVNVMLTHDVPAGGYVFKHMHFPPWVERQAYESRELLRLAVENTRPDLVFSGHWHQRVTSRIERLSDGGETTIHVLHMNGHDSNAVIVDLPGLGLIEGTEREGWHHWTRRGEKQAKAAEARRLYRLAQQASNPPE